MNNLTSWLLLADLSAGARSYALILGIASFCGGIMLLRSHKRTLDEAQAATTDSRVQRFEQRKFRRRALVSSMIASMGCMLGALYWVTEPRPFVSLMLLIFGLLIGIVGIAFIDMFSVSLQSIAHTESADHRALLKDYLQRKQAAAVPREVDTKSESPDD